MPEVVIKAEGDATYQFILAEAYEHGVEVKQDFSRAYYWNIKAGNSGIAAAQHQLGLYNLFCTEDLNKSIEWFLAAIDNGDNPESIFYLAYIAVHFADEESIRIEGVNKIKSMAVQGFPLAMLEFANLLKQGQYLSQDNKAAFLLYQDVVNRGYKPGLFELSLCYLDGIGVVKNRKMYLDILMKSANAGDKRAKRQLKYN
ncbi:hypothetical protein PE36_08151 [Moritella sp. PE36]|nr:hypothetical protein PE36_08151 [Moritella sp. PE36]